MVTKKQLEKMLKHAKKVANKTEFLLNYGYSVAGVHHSLSTQRKISFNHDANVQIKLLKKLLRTYSK